MTSELVVRSLVDASPDLVVAAFNTSFAGYSVPVAQSHAELDARFRAEDGDPRASYVFSSADEPRAILLTSRRGWTSRVAAMGVAPAMRGTGLGETVVRRAVTEAAARGDARLVLEVIEGNTRALLLYERAGFAIDRPLWGFSLDGGPSGVVRAAPAIEVDPFVGACQAGRFAMADLPWPLQVPSLAAMVRPTRCFTDARGSLVAMVDATQPTVRLRALAFAPDLVDDGAGAFTASLRATFPGRPWAAPPLFPEVHRTRFFGPGGWATTALRQWEMRHALGVDCASHAAVARR